ncbi:MAG TPA: hypothetical protein VNP73_09200 [Actinomycetota bacterium]|nr:hypothetical protein [Actinomycetota bacterium]
MRRRIASLAVALVAVLGLSAAPAAAEDFTDCEGTIVLFCPGPVPITP